MFIPENKNLAHSHNSDCVKIQGVPLKHLNLN